jgi:uncharacterized protein YegP (UPF0339 family)
MSTLIPRPCWELRGKPGAYGVVFVGRNGQQMLGNKVQGYSSKADALHVLEVVYDAPCVPLDVRGWCLPVGDIGDHVHVRDATDKAVAKKAS